jgi:hypothetical protein
MPLDDRVRGSAIARAAPVSGPAAKRQSTPLGGCADEKLALAAAPCLNHHAPVPRVDHRPAIDGLAGDNFDSTSQQTARVFRFEEAESKSRFDTARPRVVSVSP